MLSYLTTNGNQILQPFGIPWPGPGAWLGAPPGDLAYAVTPKLIF
jgi:hypothetical protein